MKRTLLALAVLLLLALGTWWSAAQAVATAEALGQANLRAATDTNSVKVGEITSGTVYPVIGRSEFFPWVLLGDPNTQQPIGWVYQDLVTIRGALNAVPISTLILDPATLVTAPPAAAPNNPQPTSAPLAQPTATLTPTYSVTGTVRGEVNVRYGPGVDYPRVGVANAGERFELSGYHTQYPWVQVRYANSPNGYAWIARDLLDIQGNIFTLPAISDGVLVLPTLTPTPSVVLSSNLHSGEAVPISPAFARLGEQIWELMLRNRFDPQTSRFGALFLMDLQTGEAITFGNDIAFSGTSVNKIPILVRLYGTLNEPPNAQTATDIANTMICSENVATNRLLSIIGNGNEFTGAEEVTRFMNALGMKNSFLLSPYVTDPQKPPIPPRPIRYPTTGVDQVRAQPDLSNQLTVDEVGWLLADVYQCAYGDGGILLEKFGDLYEPRECRQMLHVMSNNTVDGLLKAGIPEGVRVAHKHGWIDTTHSNAGIFFTEGGDFVMVMMVFQPSWLLFSESLPVIAESARLAYNYFNPSAPMPAIRDGIIPEAPTCNFANTPLITDLRQPIWDK